MLWPKRFRLYLLILTVTFFCIIFKLNDESYTDGTPQFNEFYSEHNCSCRFNQRVQFDNSSLRNGKSYFEIRYLQDELEVSRFELIEEEFYNLRLSCGIFNGLKRGPNQKVVAYSLFGNKTLYYEKLLELTQIIADKYPGWIMRVYYDDRTVDQSIICQIECAKKRHSDEFLDNADFCNINKIPDFFGSTWSAGYIHGTMWRWLPLGDAFVDILSSRDSDSYILDRELASVDEWLNSSNLFHVMRGN